MTWFKLTDKNAKEITDLVAGFQDKRKKHNEDHPYVLWGAVGTEMKKGGRRVHQARVIEQTSAAGIRRVDVERLAHQKNFVILDYYFPDASILDALSDEYTNFESGWKLGLRENPAFFAGARKACEQITAEQDGDSIHQTIITEKDRELAEKDAIIAKLKEFQAEEKAEKPVKEKDAKKDKARKEL